MESGSVSATTPEPSLTGEQAWLHRWVRADDVLLLALLVLGSVVIALLDDGLGLVGSTAGKVFLTLSIAVVATARRPLLLAIAAAIAVALGGSELALPATLYPIALVARDRRLTVAVTAASLGYMVARWESPAAVNQGAAALAALANCLVFVGLPVALGAYVGTQRQLERQLREDAVRSEREQQLRADRARQEERTRIAREMHDVLAQQMSLVVLHAGALEVSVSPGRPDVEHSARLVRSSAHNALEELRAVLGVLRGTSLGDDFSVPQPTSRELRALLETEASAGLEVRLDNRVGPQPLPAQLSRAAYRVVQEGLTNVHKHAPGATASVLLAGEPGGILTVEVCNGEADGPASAPSFPQAGFGLVGLEERVDLAGGIFSAGPLPTGGFRIRAQMPWPRPSEAGQ